MSSVKRNDDMGRLAANLKQSGIEPADVDAVIPTHAHIDHIGGIMAADGSRNFPNAQIYISQADLEFWTDDKRLGTPAEGSALAARKNLIPNRDRIVFYKDGQEVLPGVQAMHTPGHTVGHTSFVVNSGGKSLFVVGDLMHHVILVEKPRMEVGFDTDPKQGIETRVKVMDMLAAQRMPALVYHLPWPGIGHFARRLPLRGGADATGALVRCCDGPRRQRGEGFVAKIRHRRRANVQRRCCRGERAVIAALVPDDCRSQAKRARGRASSLRDNRASLLHPWLFCSAVPLPLSR
jgi:glyoxylase-like metal-dependent hydrolase (beta-lactamase superfamily II)